MNNAKENFIYGLYIIFDQSIKKQFIKIKLLICRFIKIMNVLSYSTHEGVYLLIKKLN